MFLKLFLGHAFHKSFTNVTFSLEEEFRIIDYLVRIQKYQNRRCSSQVLSEQNKIFSLSKVWFPVLFSAKLRGPDRQIHYVHHEWKQDPIQQADREEIVPDGAGIYQEGYKTYFPSKGQF